MGKKLYVGNLAYSIRDNDLEQAFGQYGSVASAKVMMERDSGRSKGFGFVEMGTDAEALSTLNEEKQNAGVALSEPTLTGTLYWLPPSNSMPSVKPLNTMLPIAISRATPATVNQSRRRPTTLTLASSACGSSAASCSASRSTRPSGAMRACAIRRVRSSR